MNSLPMKVLYTNLKGKTQKRNIIPTEIYFDSNEWFEEEQWLLDAIDVDKNALRTFAMNNITFIYGDNDDEKLDIIKKEFRM